MGAVIHETCVEYFKRRLAEGWKCIGIEGDIASLLSPDGSFHKLDLKNDTVTLRPDGVGSSTQLGVGAGGGPNWAMCDEVAADDFTTYVMEQADLTYQLDLYRLPNPGLAGTINSVTIYCRIGAHTVGGQNAQSRGAYKTNAVTYYYGTVTGGSGWYNRDTGALANNPQSGSPWTWDEIDALEIGLSIHGAYESDPKLNGWTFGYGTQTYAIVDYTEEVVVGSKTAGMAAKMVSAGGI